MLKKIQKGPALHIIAMKKGHALRNVAKKGLVLRSPDAVYRDEEGFTIIELLTVMTIIILLISVLVPGLNRIRKLAKDVTQRSAFYDIDKALADYRNDHQDEYPDSNMFDYDPDPTGRKPYCGAMKLCEALMGQDGMGYHADSKLMSVPGLDSEGLKMYPFSLCDRTDPADETAEQKSSKKKRTRYLENLNIKPVWLAMLYGQARANTYSTAVGAVNAILTDVYKRTQIDSVACPALAGEKVGMPILYYKADVRKSSLDANDPITPNSDNIYDYRDNHYLIALGLPWDETVIPPMADMFATPPGPKRWFYERITNPAVTATPTPFKKDDYILISAGWDGIFGSNDDIFNFDRR
jgi:type II secretory pathway pseudopilin PulG